MFKHLFKELKDLLLYASVGEENYKKIKLDIAEYNRHNLVVYTSVATALVSLFYILSFYIDSLVVSRNSYIMCIIVSVVLLFVANGPAKKHPLMINVSMNVFECTVLGIGIALGTIVDPYHASMTYIVLMFAVPLLFASAPWRIIMLTIVCIVIYTFLAIRTQGSDVFTFNVSCIYPFGAISVIVTSFIRRMKIRTFVDSYKVRVLDEITALNKQLEEARAAAEASNKAKTAFLNNMSHDIRTPMNAILGFTELMERRKDDPKVVADYLNKIKGSGQYLLTIINNVLDLARIDSGNAKVDESLLDMTDADINVAPMFESLLNEKHLTFHCHQNIEHKYLWVDIVKLNQIMVNLLSNAVKYTPDGGSISYTVDELPSDREGYAHFVAKVSDTGIGMSKEFLGHVFDDFARERNTTQSKIMGTGLGMSIVKRLVDLLGYEITVESELGKGTTFTVTSYMKIAQQPENYFNETLVENVKNISLEGKRVLLAEDNALNAEIAVAILEDTGLKVEVAVDGVECVKMLSDNEAGYYDAILMDIQMPNLNGYEATQRIRNLEDKAKANIPILAMTANAFEEDKKEAFRVGMNAHISKPINMNELMKTLVSTLKIKN